MHETLKKSEEDQ